MLTRWQRWITLCCVALFLLSLAIPVWAAFKVPKYDGYVTDKASIISPETARHITAIAKELKQKTDSEIAVLTVNSLEGTPVEDAGLQVGRTWGVGSKEGNTGVLILVAVQDRELRIEVGYGIEGIITDGTAGQIRDQLMIPAFREGDFSRGIFQAVVACAQLIAHEHQVELESLSGVPPVQMQDSESDSENAWFVVIIILTLFLLNIMRFGRRGWLGGGFYGGSFGGGFGNGSFGGFGGGSFGGGGASGRW